MICFDLTETKSQLVFRAILILLLTILLMDCCGARGLKCERGIGLMQFNYYT